METDYYYPPMADRYPQSVWESMGSQSIRDRARQRTKEILSQHYPNYIDPKVDEAIRKRFNIVLPEENLRPSSRWKV